MMRRLSLIFVPLLVLGLLSSCGKKRRPAVVTDPSGRTTSATPSPLPVPTPDPADAGPDVAALPPETPRAEDYSAADASSAEGGPLADVHFDYDQATLSDEARGILEKHALWLQSHRDAKVTIEGHCDERGTTDYNLALGDKRARAARDYLASLGVAGERLVTVSLGKEKPLDTGSNEAAWARNRRAHFVVGR